MILLAAENLRKYYAVEPVLDGASLEIRAGEHVALVGPNGAGKTTLLNILMGDLAADAGELRIAPGARIGFLRQQVDLQMDTTVWQVAREAMRHVFELHERATRIAVEMAEAAEPAHSELARRYDSLHQQLQQSGGYEIEYRIRRVLDGLGFTAEFDERLVGQLSGGQQNRLMLARLLLEEPDLMLLDEPSNHLDIEATAWLERYLADARQAFLLVSHDRYFIDRVTHRTLELVNGRVDSFPGNYSKYKVLKEQRLEVQRRTWERQREEIEKLKDFIRRNHYGQKAAQAEDRRKKLERIELVEVPREIPVPRMKFHDVSRCGDIVMSVEGLAKSWDEPLFSGVRFQIERGQRWGIIGANGSGKTTLLRCLLGEIRPDEGTVRLGTGVEPGYFDQHLHCIDGDAISAEAIRPRDESRPELRMDELARRDMLARFGITGDTALQTVSSLSGGQRNRVALANLAAQRANFLVMDEPTNHLDLWAREALETAINEFEGTLLIVSHDRYFLNRVCTHLLILENRTVRIVEGNYDTWMMLQQREQEDKARATATRPTAAPSRKHRSENGGEGKRKRRFPWRKVEQIETDIAACETRIEELHFALADPNTFRDPGALRSVKSELDDQNLRLQELYEHWEEATELN